MNFKRFEYKIVEATPKGKWHSSMDIDANEAILIGHGLDGWELVQVYPQMLPSGLTAHYFFLKRELPPKDIA